MKINTNIKKKFNPILKKNNYLDCLLLFSSKYSWKYFE